MCSDTPNRNPCFSAAARHRPTTSLCGPICTAFHLWYLLFHKSKLSWWHPIDTKYFAPAAL